GGAEAGDGRLPRDRAAAVRPHDLVPARGVRVRPRGRRLGGPRGPGPRGGDDLLLRNPRPAPGGDPRHVLLRPRERRPRLRGGGRDDVRLRRPRGVADLPPERRPRDPGPAGAGGPPRGPVPRLGGPAPRPRRRWPRGGG